MTIVYWAAIVLTASALGWGIVLLGHRAIYGRWLP